MAIFSSNEHGLQVGAVATPLEPTQAMGRVRLAHFQYDALTAAAGDTLNLIKMPAGKVRVLQVKAIHSAFVLNSTLSFGNGIFTNRSTRAAVAAAVASITPAIPVDNTTDINRLSDTIIDSSGGFTVTGTLAVAGVAAGTIRGWVEYVVD